jgi:ABC-2 type transport system ATP-binding protein
MIEVTNLTKKYGDHVAVDNLSFTVEKGQIYGFLGPNGAGKSTTMNIITGYLAATEGTVLINGKDIQKEPEEAKKCVGYLPELPPLYIDMTVAEYLRFVAELKKVPKAERTDQVAEVMEMTQITDKKDRLIKNLSKGYRQRVGFAQALLGFPEVIILDEPTVGLDPKQIIEIRDLIKKLGENHTIILSSHILSEVSAVCDHIMIISKGKLVASDSPEGLQKMMSGSPELEVLIKGDTDKVRGVLENVSGVATVSEDASGEAQDNAECRKYKIVADADIDLRESIFYACADNHLPIMGMTYNRKSLEDIFLELTGGNQPEEEKVKTGLFGRRHSAAKSVEEADSDTKDNAESTAFESGTVNKEEEE